MSFDATHDEVRLIKLDLMKFFFIFGVTADELRYNTPDRDSKLSSLQIVIGCQLRDRLVSVKYFQHSIAVLLLLLAKY